MAVHRCVLSLVSRGAGVVQVGDDAQAVLPKRHGAVRVQQVGLVLVDQVCDPVEPSLVPPGVVGVPASSLMLDQRLIVVRQVEILVLGIVPVVRNARVGAGLVAALVVRPPGKGRAEVLRDPKGQIERSCGGLPQAHDVLLGSYPHGVPGIVGRVPVVKVVVMHRLSAEIPGPGIDIELHQPFGVEPLGFPELDYVLPAVLGGVPVDPPVMGVLVGSLSVHVPCVPVAEHRYRLWPPVRPDPELGVPEPIWTLILAQGLPRGLERTFLNVLPFPHDSLLFKCGAWTMRPISRRRPRKPVNVTQSAPR